MISVIIPVYNVEDYLHMCINSVLKQSYQDFEIICVDDASTDSSLDILEYFVKKDQRIKLIKNESNCGLGYSRNRGLEAAKGKYVMFLDSDDWYSFDTFETLINNAEKNELEVLMFRVIVYYEKTQEFGMEKYYDMEFMKPFVNKIFTHWDVDKKELFKIPTSACNKLYLKSFLDKNNIKFIDENYINEDNPFFSKVLLSAEKISLIDNYFYIRRRRENSIMTFTNERLLDAVFIVELILNNFMEDEEIYEYHKEFLLTYIFVSVLNNKYNKIDDEYKDIFYNEIQDVYKKFISEYGLYKDIKEFVNENVLNRFNFDEIVENLLLENSE